MRIGVKPTIKTAEVIETNGIEEVGRKEDMEESVSVASRATETSRNSKEPSVHSEVKPQLARHLNSCTSLNDFDTSSLSDFTGSCSEDVNVVRKGSKFRTKIRCLSTSEATDKQPLPNSFHESLPTPLGLRKPNELHSNDSLLSSIEISVADKPATPSALRKRPNLVPSINVELLEDTEICKEAVDVVYSFSESILSQKGPSIVKTKSKPSQKKLPARIVSLAGAEHPEISST